MNKEYLSDEEFRAEFSISRTTSWRLRKEGKGPNFMILGGRICYPVTEIRRWVSENLQRKQDRIRQLDPLLAK